MPRTALEKRLTNLGLQKGAPTLPGPQEEDMTRPNLPVAVLTLHKTEAIPRPPKSPINVLCLPHIQTDALSTPNPQDRTQGLLLSIMKDPTLLLSIVKALTFLLPIEKAPPLLPSIVKALTLLLPIENFLTLPLSIEKAPTFRLSNEMAQTFLLSIEKAHTLLLPIEKASTLLPSIVKALTLPLAIEKAPFLLSIEMAPMLLLSIEKAPLLLLPIEKAPMLLLFIDNALTLLWREGAPMGPGKAEASILPKPPEELQEGPRLSKKTKEKASKLPNRRQVPQKFLMFHKKSIPGFPKTQVAFLTPHKTLKEATKLRTLLGMTVTLPPIHLILEYGPSLLKPPDRARMHLTEALRIPTEKPGEDVLRVLTSCRKVPTVLKCPGEPPSLLKPLGTLTSL